MSSRSKTYLRGGFRYLIGSRSDSIKYHPALMVGGTIFERGRYRKAQAEIPGAGFERTAEAFNDPASGGEVVDVWYNKTTGERRYVQRR